MTDWIVEDAPPPDWADELEAEIYADQTTWKIASALRDAVAEKDKEIDRLKAALAEINKHAIYAHRLFGDCGQIDHDLGIAHRQSSGDLASSCM